MSVVISVLHTLQFLVRSRAVLHLEIMAADFLVVPTMTFRLLFVLVTDTRVPGFERVSLVLISTSR